MSEINPEDTTNRPIEDLLRSIQPKPGERYYQQIANAPWAPTRTHRQPGWSKKYRFAALAAGFLVLVLALLTTPAGSVVANEILRFFTRAQGNGLPVPTDQYVAPIPSPSPAPTRDLAVLPAEQVARTTPTPKPTATAYPGMPTELSLAEAEALAGFDLYEPLRLPRDYRLRRIFYNSYVQAIQMDYASPRAGSGEYFSIIQGKNLPPVTVGADAEIETFQVGDYTAELVRGIWFADAGSTQSTWREEPEWYTIRWQAQDITIEIGLRLNETVFPAYISHDEMIALARDVVRCPANVDFKCQLSQVSAAASFTPLQLPSPPAGFAFQGVDYRPGLTALIYGNGEQQLTILQATDKSHLRQADPIWSSAPTSIIQVVDVAGWPGEMIQGLPVPPSTWNPEAAAARIRWENGNTWFQMIATGGIVPEQAQDLIALASQLTPDESLAKLGRQPTPQPPQDIAAAYTDFTELEAAAGFDILEPAVLPDELNFSHARYLADPGIVMLFYGKFAADLMHSSGPVLRIHQREKYTDSLETPREYPTEAIKPVDINGYPGILWTGSLHTTMPVVGQPTPSPTWVNDGSLSLIWQTDQMELSLNFSPGRFGERLTTEDLLQIAESLH